MSEAKIVLSAVDQTRAAFDSAQAGIKGLHTAAVGVAGALGALGVAGAALNFASSIKGAIDAADQINKLSQRTGVAAESLSQLQFAAKLSDVSAESLTSGLKKLNLSIADGLAGDKAKVEAFRNLGIALKDASGQAKSADKVLLEISNSFKGAQDGATKTAYAVALLGKAGDEMIPLLNGGGRAIEDAMKKADKLGLTISTQFAAQSEEFNDNLAIILQSSNRLAVSLGGDLVAGLGEVLRKMAEASVEGGKFAAVLAGAQAVANGLTGRKGGDSFIDTKKLAAAAAEVIDLENARKRLANGMAMGFYGPQFQADMDKTISELERAKAAFRALDKAIHPDKSQLATGDFSRMDRAPAAAPLKALTGGGGTPEVSAYAAVNKVVMERLALQAAELTAGRELSEMEKLASKALQDLRESKVKVSAADQQSIEDKLANLKAQEALVVGMRSEAKARMESAVFIAKAFEDEEKAIRKADEALAERGREQLATGRLTLEQLQFETRLLTMNTREREMASAERELERQGIVRGTEAWEQYADAIIRATGDRAELQQNIDRFKAGWESIDRTAHDVFTNIFEGGSNVFKKLGQTLKASLLDLLYQMTVKKWIFQIYGNVSGGGQYANAVGMGGGGGNMISAGSNAYSLWNGGGTGMAASYLASPSAYASVVPGLTATGPGSQAAMLSAQTGTFGAQGLSATSAAGGGMTAAAAAGWALAAVAVIAAIHSMTKGEKRGGGGYGFDPATGKFTDREKPSGGDPAADLNKTLISITAAGINDALRAIGSAATLTGFQAAYETSNSGRGGVYAGGMLSNGATFGESGAGTNYNPKTAFESKYEFDGKFNGSPADLAIDVQQAFIQALQASVGLIPKIVAEAFTAIGPVTTGTGMDATTADGEISGVRYKNVYDEGVREMVRATGALPKRLADLILDIDPESLTDEATTALATKISTLVANVNGFRAMVEALPIDQLRGATFDIAAGLVELSGGLEKFGANISAFIDNFYTDEEKRRFVAGNISSTLAGAGMNIGADAILTATRKQFRDLVEAQDLTTEAGRKSYAALLSVAGAFAGITPAAEAAAGAIGGVVDALAGQRQTLEDEIYTLSHTELEGIALARKREVESIDASLRPLQERIYVLRDERAAAQAASEAARATAAQRTGLETRILALQGHTAELRARELAALDPSNRSLQLRIWKLEDEKTASEQATAAAKALADQRLGLESRLLEAQGNVAALRDRELAALDPSNRSLQLRIWKLEDEKTASEQATAAAKALADQRLGLESRLLEAQGNVAALRDRELQALDASLRPLLNMVYALEDAKAAAAGAAAATDKTYSDLERAVNAQRSLAQVSLDLAQEQLGAIKGVFSLLKEQVRALYSEVSSTANQGAARGNAFIDNALLAARSTGYLPDEAALSDAIGAVRGEMGRRIYATTFEQDRDRLVLAGKLAQLQEVSGGRLSTAEKQLEAAEGQLESLDGVLEAARSQIDVLRGIDAGVLSVAGALDNLALALVREAAAAKALATVTAGSTAVIGGGGGTTVGGGGTTVGGGGTTVGGGGTTVGGGGTTVESGNSGAVAGGKTEQWSESGVGALWQSAGGAVALRLADDLSITGKTGNRYSASEAVAFANAKLAAGDVVGLYDRLVAEGISAASFDALMEYAPGTSNAAVKSLGLASFDVGTNYVTRDQLALVHEGEAIIPKRYNPAAGAGAGGGRLEALVQDLTAEVGRLNALVGEGNRERRRATEVLTGEGGAAPMRVRVEA